MLSLHDFLPYRLSIASNAVSDRVAHVYQARFGLKIPEWRVIAVVAEQGHTTQAGLVAATQMDKMTISRAVVALVERGLLARTEAADRRTLELALTAEGKALNLALFAGFDRLFVTVSERLGEAAARQMQGQDL